MRRKIVSILAGITILTIVFTACSGSLPPAQDRQSASTAHQNGTYNYNFSSFELDIDTPEYNDAVEVSFEEKKNGFVASYKNKMANLKLTNGKAMEQLDPIFTSLDIDQETPAYEVIQRVSETFGGVDYTEFELEVVYKEGGEKEYTDRR